MKYRNVFILTIILTLPQLSAHALDEAEVPILIVGASYANGKMPFNDGLISPLFGIAINAGSYLDLGQGLSHRKRLVINEAQAGATTFERLGCNPGPQCGPGKWDSYTTQFQRALARVANPATPGIFNANYVLISTPNDCLHSDAFGIPQTETSPCTQQERDDVATRLIDLGHEAISSGITPIYSIYPEYQDLNLPLAIQLAGLLWEIDEHDYNDLRNVISVRIAAELPEALLVDSWAGFEHLGDGIHPDTNTTMIAIRRIEWAILEFEYFHH